MPALLPFLIFFFSVNAFAAEATSNDALLEPLETFELTASSLKQDSISSETQSTSTITINFSREDFDNPVVEIRTNVGSMILELFPDEAPLAVANFLGLAEGTLPWIDPETGEQVLRPLYDGSIFHRVIDGFMIQGGSPTGSGAGNPGFQFRDEINARSLGLDKMQVIDQTGSPHPILAISNQQDFQQKILIPLYQEMGISSQDELDANIDEVNRRIRNMTVKESFENLGYQYTERIISRMPVRGVIALANSVPNSNGSQFFINLVDTDWLAGKHTVFGKVRVGLDVLDAIGKVEVDSQSRPLQDIVIFSIRQLEP
ncbi:MAG: cyclophilin family peptidyl-prolyl cis-trans isomerase [Pseudohongiellaceae bacterium]|jgi:cyclophilin family peptidyl-prolyl cis-trans isomerase